MGVQGLTLSGGGYRGGSTEGTDVTCGPYVACVHAQSLQLCLTLCDPMDCSVPGSSFYGIFQDENTGVGCQALLQGNFPTQGSNLWHLLHLLHRR